MEYESDSSENEHVDVKEESDTSDGEEHEDSQLMNQLQVNDWYTGSSEKSHPFLEDEDFALAAKIQRQHDEKVEKVKEEKNDLLEKKKSYLKSANRTLNVGKVITGSRFQRLSEINETRTSDAPQKRKRPRKKRKKKVVLPDERYRPKITAEEDRTWQWYKKQTNREGDIIQLKKNTEDQMKAKIMLAEARIAEGEEKTDRTSLIEIDPDVDPFSHTSEVKQEDIVKEVDLQTKSKVFDIQLQPSGKGYIVRYCQSSKFLLIFGQSSGMIAPFNWKKFKLLSEIRLKGDHAKDIIWMMNDAWYAICTQRHLVKIFNAHTGQQLHKISEFRKPEFLCYLPYHFLMVAATRNKVFYRDISLGKTIANISFDTPISCMTSNPQTAIICLGHTNGCISMVTPRDEDNKPAAYMNAFNKLVSIRDMRVSFDGKWLVALSNSFDLAIFNVDYSQQSRFSFGQCVGRYKSDSPITCLALSQSNILAIGQTEGRKIQIYTLESLFKLKSLNKEPLSLPSPYLKHQLPRGLPVSLDFCPYEDVLAIGHSHGVSSILVPGSGVSKFDSRIENPYMTDRAERNLNVQRLLEKLPSDMIALDPNQVGASFTKPKSKNILMEDDEFRIKREKKRRANLSKDENLILSRKLKDDQLKDTYEQWFDNPNAKDGLDRFLPRQSRKKKKLNSGEAEPISDSDEDDEEITSEDDDLEKLIAQNDMANDMSDSEEEKEEVMAINQSRSIEESVEEESDEEMMAQLL